MLAYVIAKFNYIHFISLTGDSGYPLEPWLLTPFAQPNPGTVEEFFNSKHASARNCVERCNGVLKSRFRCLSRHRVMHYSPTKSSLIVNACAVLHNLCTKYGLQLDDDEEPLHPDDLISIHINCDHNNVNLLLAARSIRYRVASQM